MIVAMAYPRKLLADDERAELELHPHPKALFWPVLLLLVVVPAASFAAARVPAGDAQVELTIASGAVVYDRQAG